MKLSVEQVEQFYQNHENNTTPNFLKNHMKPVIRILDICLEDTEDVVECLKKPKEVKKKITDIYDNPNTQKFYFQSILFLIDQYPDLAKNVNRAEYKKYWEESKVLKAENDKNAPTIANIDFVVIAAAVEEEYGTDSEEALFVNLYYEMPMRLDFHDLYVDDSEQKNYIDTNKKRIIVNEYSKTSKKYGQKNYTLSTKLIKQIIKQNKTNNKLFTFFTKSNQGKKIKEMLHFAGIDGTLNTLRHSRHSVEMTSAERVDIAARSGHAPETSLTYIRI